MGAKIKKGDVVYLFGDYDHGSTCSYEKLVIMSLGAKQGTAYSLAKGENYKQRLYEHEYADIMRVSDVPDVEAEAMRRAAGYRAYWTRHYVECAHRSIDAGDSYHISMKKDCEKMLAKPLRALDLDAR